MANYYVIGVEGLKADDERRFLEYLKKQNIDWWHWVDNFWLLKANSPKLGADIRTFLKGMDNSRRGLVLEVEPVFWNGFFESGKPIFEWVHENWGKDVDSK